MSFKLGTDRNRFNLFRGLKSEADLLVLYCDKISVMAFTKTVLSFASVNQGSTRDRLLIEASIPTLPRDVSPVERYMVIVNCAVSL